MKIKWLLPCWFLACSLFPPLSSFGEEITGFPDMMFYRYRIHRSIRYLYPEVDIYQFPAVISRVDKTLYAPGVNIRWEREAHLENNGGTGFRQETNQEVDSGLNLIGIHPLSEAWTLGYMVSGGEKWRQTRKDYQDWDWNSNGYLEDQEEDFEARHGALDWSTTDIGFLSWEGERLSLGGSACPWGGAWGGGFRTKP